MNIYIITKEEQHSTNEALCKKFNIENAVNCNEDFILTQIEGQIGPAHGLKWSKDSKLKLANSKRGLFCYYDPITLKESWHKDTPSYLIKGRSPKTKHGGKIGEYNNERNLKISASNKGRNVWNKGITHSEKTKHKMSELAILRPVICCIQCQKAVKGNSNFLQHLRAKH